MRGKNSFSDEEIRAAADILGDWLEKDAIIHIPLQADVERDKELGAWVDCKILIPWERIRNPFQS